MRWWAWMWAVAGVAVLTACGTSAGGPSGGAPSLSGPAAAPPSSAAGCPAAAGRAEVHLGPGDAVAQRLCVRPGAVVSLVLDPRADDKRWTAVRSSAPALVLVSGWRVDADGTARASLRCAGTRGGTAEVTAQAKAPDVSGAARVAFTLHVDVLPHTTQG